MPPDQPAAAHAAFGTMPLWVQALALALLSLYPAWAICRRAGVHPAWSLLVFLQVAVPVLGLAPLMAVLLWKPWTGVAGRPVAAPRRQDVSRSYGLADEGDAR